MVVLAAVDRNVRYHYHLRKFIVDQDLGLKYGANSGLRDNMINNIQRQFPPKTFSQKLLAGFQLLAREIGIG